MDKFFDVIRSMPTPFNFITIVGICTIICGAIIWCTIVYLNYTLKRDMLRKGMSAEEIERVINAGGKNSQSKNRLSEQD